jgi:hypothetical protein
MPTISPTALTDMPVPAAMAGIKLTATNSANPRANVHILKASKTGDMA